MAATSLFIKQFGSNFVDIYRNHLKYVSCVLYSILPFYWVVKQNATFYGLFGNTDRVKKI